ncbi:Transmembrane protein [Phytophthora cinnamomi]|uniref:Transmembrane protein n=2 Tax=Phytophthora cinnamomi TaxID=4785 RepID=UPI003559E5C3|nr:Transmembrane protein [Phytophthora cinnamomi]
MDIQRFSTSSLPPKAEDYREVKTPDSSTLEDGAIRPGGPPNLYSWSNIGLMAQYAAVGVVYGTMYSIIYPFLTNYLRMSGNETTSASVLITLPYTLKVFIGIITDCYPIFGFRRRPYMLIGWAVCFVSLLVMTAMPIGDPYYPDSSWASLTTLTADQTAQLNTDAQHSGVKYIFLMVIANLGSVVAFTASDGILVELAQREPLKIRGTLQAVVYAVQYTFQIISSAMIGFGLNSADYGGTFSGSMGVNAVMGVCAAFSLVVMPFSWFCITEEKTHCRSVQKYLYALYELIQQRVVYQIVIFRFCRNVFSYVSVTASSLVQSYWLSVSPVNSSVASIIGLIVSAGSLYLTKQFGLNWNWRYMIAISQIAVILIDAFPTFFTIWDVYRSQWFWLGVPLVENFPSAVGTIIATFAVLEIIEEGNEATVYGLITAVSTLASPFASVITKSIDGHFDVETEYIRLDNSYVRWQVTYTYLIAYAFKLCSLAFLVLLPKQKAETQELKRTGGKNKWVGILTIIAVAFSLVWSVMTNLMTMFDSTSCLRIAGGTGC